MPTREYWADEDILATMWESPLTAGELATCFQNLAAMIDSRTRSVPVLFDIRTAGCIPSQAPVLAIRSGFLTSANTGRVAVIGTNIFAETLANVATSITRHKIRFFPCPETAAAYLKPVEV